MCEGVLCVCVLMLHECDDLPHKSTIFKKRRSLVRACRDGDEAGEGVVCLWPREIWPLNIDQATSFQAEK